MKSKVKFFSCVRLIAVLKFPVDFLAMTNTLLINEFMTSAFSKSDFASEPSALFRILILSLVFLLEFTYFQNLLFNFISLAIFL